MSRNFPAVIVLFLAALLGPVAPAQADSSVICTGYSSCTGKGYSHGGYSSNQRTSYWNMYTGTNCTNYVAYRLVATNGMPNKRPKPGVGNARDWGTTMSSITDSTPTSGSVAWWGSKVGGNHVAYVEKVVSSSEIWVSESNWSGAFDWRKITKSGRGWPQGFIHFSDRVLKNTARPTLGSTPVVGVPLDPSVGRWTVMGNTYKYRWTADGATISGATGKSYTPTPGVAGKDLALTVTASRSGWSSSSAASAAAEVRPGAVTSVARPAIAGTPAVGVPLTADAGQWSVSGLTHAYQWSIDGTPVPGATTDTFTPRPADRSKPATVRVTASRSGYVTTSATSAATADVAAGTMAPSTPTITGAPRLGSTLAVAPGERPVPGATATYQWLRDGQEKAGATAQERKVIASDLGKALSVRVTWSAPGYTSRTVTTAALAPAKATASLVATAKPSTRTVRFAVRLPVAGMADPSGSVVVARKGGGDVTFKVTGGSGTITLKRQPTGNQTYTFSYAGSATITSASTTVTARVK